VSIWLRGREALSRLLDPAEREAVFGDFAELAMTERQSAESLFGLVVRRQLRLWKAWNPWFALLAVVVPVSPRLARLSNQLCLEIWPGLVMWLHHGPTNETGLSPAANVAGFCLQAMALITWSWTSGFALRKLSRKTIWVSGMAFFAIYLVVLVRVNGVLFLALSWLGLSINLLLVLLPAYCGIRQRSWSLNRKSPRTAVLVFWTLTISGLALWTWGWSEAAMDNWSRGASALTLWQLIQHAGAWRSGMTHILAAAALTGPVLYVVAKDAFSQHPTN
jgi:hypothetical protein